MQDVSCRANQKPHFQMNLPSRFFYQKGQVGFTVAANLSTEVKEQAVQSDDVWLQLITVLKDLLRHMLHSSVSLYSGQNQLMLIPKCLQFQNSVKLHCKIHFIFLFNLSIGLKHPRKFTNMVFHFTSMHQSVFMLVLWMDKSNNQVSSRSTPQLDGNSRSCSQLQNMQYSLSTSLLSF